MGNIGLGINSNFGYAEETTYGTRVEPSGFLNVTSEGLVLNQSFTPINTLGKVYNEYYVNGKRSVEGSVELPCTYDKTTGIFLKHALGSVSTSSAGIVKTHTILPSGTIPVGLSLYVDRDINAYAYAGCQISSLTLTQEVENTLNMSVEVKGKEETKVNDSTVTITAPKYIVWEDFSNTVSASGVVASGIVIKSMNVQIQNTLAEDRFGLGSNLKVGQDRGGMRTVNGSMTLEFSDAANYDWYRNALEISGNFVWTGPVISGTLTNKLEIDIPRMKVEGTTPNAGGVETMDLEIPFTAYYSSGTGYEIKAVLTNTDATI